MNFRLDFSDEQCANLLEKAGYVIETVTLYYNPDTDPYENEINPSELRGLNYKVAYPRYSKPEALCKEKPLVSECRGYLYYGVIEKFINDWLYGIFSKFIEDTH